MEVKKMENQEILNSEIGEKEAEKLKPAKVKIEDVEVVPVGEKGNKKLVCHSKHPDKAETISISEVKYESKKQLRVSGLWVNLDEDGKIRKGSAIAILLAKVGANKASELIGKELETVEDDQGYLCFKAY
jgi:hypothetical protein